MATDEEIYKIIAQVEGESEVARLTGLVEKQEKQLRDLIAQHKAGAISQAQFAAASRAAASQIAAANQQMDATRTSTRNLGQAALEASRGFEDLQYGISGVLNNIPSLVMSLGGTAGLAGAFSAAAVAGKILYDNWDSLASAFGTGSTKTEAERMEDLGKQTSKTAEETAKLARYEEQRKNVAAQRAPGPGAEGITKDVNEAIRGSGSELQFRNAIDTLRGTQISALMTPGVEEELARAKGELAKYSGRTDPVGKKLAGTRIADVTAAQKARDTAYSEARDKLQSDLVTGRDKRGEPFLLNKFLDEAAAGKLITGTGIRQIREAADPTILQSREDEAARIAENDAHNNRMLQAREDWMRGQVGQFTGKASLDARQIALRGIQGGGGVDRGALGEQVGRDLARAGVASEDVKEMAERVAEALATQLEREVKEKATKGGITAEAEAGAGLADIDIERQKQQAAQMQASLASMRPAQGGAVRGAEEFARNLLQIKGGGDRDLLQKQIDILQRNTAAAEATARAVRMGVPARAGGP